MSHRFFTGQILEIKNGLESVIIAKVKSFHYFIIFFLSMSFFSILFLSLFANKPRSRLLRRVNGFI